MNKIIPYIYFFIAVVFLFDGIRQFIQDKEQYYLFFSYTTDNKYGFLGFKLAIGLFIIFLGMKRLKALKNLKE